MIQYDSNSIQIEVNGGDEWDLYYKENNNITFSRKDLENRKENVKIGTISIKAKKDIEVDDNLIKMVNNEITDGEKLFKIKDSIMQIKQEENNGLEIDYGNYKEEGKYLQNIKPKTTIEEFVNSIDTNANIKVYKDGKLVDNSANLGTGMKVQIELDGKIVKEYTAVVKGDIDGDGKITDIDLLKTARYVSDIDRNMDQEYIMALDVISDGVYGDDKDLLKIVRVLQGLEEID